MHLLARAALAVALLSTGCKKEPEPAPAAPAAGAEPSRAPDAEAAGSPLSWKELPTTDGAITFGNLEGEIGNLDRMLEKNPQNAAAMIRQAMFLLVHGQLTGKLAEYDRAEELAERAVKLLPKDPLAWQTRAEVRGRLHRFDDALADLATAEKLGASKMTMEQRRAGLWQALGRYAEARPLREKWARDRPSLDTLGALATLDADEGRLDEAEKRFVEAQHHFPDVSPLPVTWLYLQEGTMWQAAGRLPRARVLLEAAHQRMPADVGVISHLAAVEAATGDRAAAIALLRPLAESADDPEYAGQLADLLRADGKEEEARALRQKAAARYDAIVARHPEAFADHAARFWLAGGDGKKALALAEKNLAVRKTPDAFALVIESALAAADNARACAAADAALAAGVFRTAHHHVVAWKAYSACNRKDKADAELRAADTLAHPDAGSR